MSVALDKIRAFARRDFACSPDHEKNENYERTPAEAQVSSLNSFISFSPPIDAERLRERAALVEFGSGVPRDWAEGFAKLDPVQPPADIPPTRWRLFIDDVGRFLDSGFAAQAAMLGWTPFDLFGADSERPFARIDRAGLLWLLEGNRLIMLADNAATIEIVTGARQTYRRTPTIAGRVLAWQLSS